MTDTSRLEQALLAAHNAGDTEGATLLATAIRNARNEGLSARIQSDPSEYDPNSPEFRAKYGAASKSNFQNYMAGAGKFVVDQGRGIKQFFASDDPTLSSLITGQTAADKATQGIRDARARDRDLMATKAGKFGNASGAVAEGALLSMIPGMQGYAGSITTGGLLGATQPVDAENGESRLWNTLVGGASGAAGKYASDRVTGLVQRAIAQRAASRAAAQGAASATPGSASAQTTISANPQVSATGGGSGFGHVGEDVSAGLNPAEQQALASGMNLGMRATPGTATGSRALKQMEAKLESQPMTSGPFNAIKDNNQRVLNREVAASIGERANTVDSTVINSAHERLGGIFNAAADKVDRTIDPNAFLGRLSNIEQQYDGLLGDTGIAGHQLVRKLMNYAAKGEANGEQLHQLSSQIGKAARQQLTSATGNRELGLALYEVREMTDDLLQSTMNGRQLAQFQQARGQYRNLMNLESSSGVFNPSNGNVNGISYANMLQQRDKFGFMRGQNRSGAYEAARFAQSFKPIVGDSGTATRSGWQSPIDMLASAPLNIASRLYTSSPAVRMSMGANAAANGAGSVLGPLLRPAAPVAPYVLPGLFSAYATQQ